MFTDDKVYLPTYTQTNTHRYRFTDTNPALTFDIIGGYPPPTPPPTSPFLQWSGTSAPTVTLFQEEGSRPAHLPPASELLMWRKEEGKGPSLETPLMGFLSEVKREFILIRCG